LSDDFLRKPDLSGQSLRNDSDTLNKPSKDPNYWLMVVIFIFVINPSAPGLPLTWDMICHEHPSYRTVYQGMAVIRWINPSNGPDYWLIVVISL
jgi:hypothetical protein